MSARDKVVKAAYKAICLHSDIEMAADRTDLAEKIADAVFAATGALDGVPESGPGVYRVSLNERGWLVIEERVGDGPEEAGDTT